MFSARILVMLVSGEVRRSVTNHRDRIKCHPDKLATKCARGVVILRSKKPPEPTPGGSDLKI